MVIWELVDGPEESLLQFPVSGQQRGSFKDALTSDEAQGRVHKSKLYRTDQRVLHHLWLCSQSPQIQSQKRNNIELEGASDSGLISSYSLGVKKKDPEMTRDWFAATEPAPCLSSSRLSFL